jgi:hypothetical protein
LEKSFFSCGLFFGNFSNLFFFFPYVKPTHHPSIVNALLDPVGLLSFNFAFLGSVFLNATAAIALGIFLTLSTFAYISLVIFKLIWVDNQFLILCLFFLLLTAFAGALARSGFGLPMAVSSRYSEYCLIYIAILYIGICRNLSGKVRKIFTRCIFIFSIAIYFSCLIPGITAAQWRYDELQKQKKLSYIPNGKKLWINQYKIKYLRKINMLIINLDGFLVLMIN